MSLAACPALSVLMACSITLGIDTTPSLVSHLGAKALGGGSSFAIDCDDTSASTLHAAQPLQKLAMGAPAFMPKPSKSSFLRTLLWRQCQHRTCTTNPPLSRPMLIGLSSYSGRLRLFKKGPLDMVSAKRSYLVPNTHA